MNRLRRTTPVADIHRVSKLSNEVKLDLKLWIEFLKKAEDSTSINYVIFHPPT